MTESTKDWETLAEDELKKFQEWSARKARTTVVWNPGEALQKHFGFKEFRPGQTEVINSVMEGRDVFLVMPTGGGKSLCFQIPALVLKGTVIVVSPLIALMKDQVDALTAKNIPATFINSTLTDTEVKDRIENMVNGRYKLVYVAPERVASPAFMNALPRTAISALAVDESHCISKWGHDFRPAYRKIPRMLTKTLTRVPVIAVTATATKRVRDDIITLLGMNNPLVKVTGFRRPNLELNIEFSTDALDDILWWAKEVKKSSGEKFPPTIIYVGTKADTEKLSNNLRAVGVPCDFYNGGMEGDVREKIQNRFMSGEVPVVVATNAFGMGIDKADIRYVVHGTLPGSIEAYYQEVGRAGRDGKPSRCIMFFSLEGIRLQEYFLTSSHPSSKTARLVYKVLMDMFREMGNSFKSTYSQVSDRCKSYGHVEEREVGQTLTLLKRHGVFSAPKRSIMVLNKDHDQPDFESFDHNRAEAETRLREMLSFTKRKDLHEAILEYFGADS